MFFFSFSYFNAMIHRTEKDAVLCYKKKWCCQSVYSKILSESTNKNAKYPSKTEQEMRRSEKREEEISGTHIHGFVAFHLIWVYDEK